jgi:hypothetical protein
MTSVPTPYRFGKPSEFRDPDETTFLPATGDASVAAMAESVHPKKWFIH